MGKVSRKDEEGSSGDLSWNILKARLISLVCWREDLSITPGFLSRLSNST